MLLAEAKISVSALSGLFDVALTRQRPKMIRAVAVEDQPNSAAAALLKQLFGRTCSHSILTSEIPRQVRHFAGIEFRVQASA